MISLSLPIRTSSWIASLSRWAAELRRYKFLTEEDFRVKRWDGLLPDGIDQSAIINIPKFSVINNFYWTLGDLVFLTAYVRFEMLVPNYYVYLKPPLPPAGELPFASLSCSCDMTGANIGMMAKLSAGPSEPVIRLSKVDANQFTVFESPITLEITGHYSLVGDS